MHPRVYEEFERLCSPMTITGSVLEVGALPSRQSLLCMKSLEGASEKVGINLDGPHEFRDFRIHKGNANAMTCFEDERFDLVLSNSMLEHDPYFWKTIAEIRRVTKPGGTVVLGTPGYTFHKAEKLKRKLRRIPLLRKLNQHRYFNLFFCATMTLEVHSAPADYYRFSPSAFRDVFFEGYENVEVHEVMMPVRIIGVGTKSRHLKATC